MRKIVLLAGAVIAAALAYLLAWPVAVEPVAWSAPESAGYGGAHARNERLAHLQRVQLTPEIGPEHIAFGPDGKLYTAMLSGAVLRMNADGSSVETVASTGGRPLGLDFDANGRLIMAIPFAMPMPSWSLRTAAWCSPMPRSGCCRRNTVRSTRHCSTSSSSLARGACWSSIVCAPSLS